MRGQTFTGEAFVAGLAEAAGHRLAVHGLPWFAVYAGAPFNETFREMLEMRYLWKTPVLLDNSKLVARLGAEPNTPLAEALRAALDGMGALEPATTARAA
jgi:nucleoside-diphosphate-sugar epimerase